MTPPADPAMARQVVIIGPPTPLTPAQIRMSQQPDPYEVDVDLTVYPFLNCSDLPFPENIPATTDDIRRAKCR